MPSHPPSADLLILQVLTNAYHEQKSFLVADCAWLIGNKFQSLTWCSCPTHSTMSRRKLINGLQTLIAKGRRERNRSALQDNYGEGNLSGTT